MKLRDITTNALNVRNISAFLEKQKKKNTLFRVTSTGQKGYVVGDKLIDAREYERDIPMFPEPRGGDNSDGTKNFYHK